MDRGKPDQYLPRLGLVVKRAKHPANFYEVKMFEEFEALDKVMEDINRLKKSHELLEKLWSAHGPYRDRDIPIELWFKVCDHFGFDDSE